jgi:D-glycero-D-manno-heptose 1,7-bisphosphate phosphatase
MNYLKGKKIIILDRDGVINIKNNQNNGYILSKNMLSIYEDFLRFGKYISEKNLPMIVATNQQCVGKRLIGREQLDEIHDIVQSALQSAGSEKITKFYVCAHLDGTCECRKPLPGLLNLILQDFDCRPEEAIFFGDSLSDLQASVSARVEFVQVVRGNATMSRNSIEDFDEIILRSDTCRMF